MNNIITNNIPITTSKKSKNYLLAFVNETLDKPKSNKSLNELLPGCHFEPKKSTLDAILAYSRKK